MTTLHVLRPAAAPAVDERPPAPRLIGIGVRDHEHDDATIAWALGDAAPTVDALHIVHAYVPLRLEGCAWEPVSRARDARYLAAKRIVGQAVQRAHVTDDRMRVAGSAIAGLAPDVLIELADVVDLLVIGDDAGAPSGEQHLTWPVQDQSRCPVVCVPSTYRAGPDERPVSVLVDGSGLSAPVLLFAVAAARRHHVGLQVSRTWESLHDGSDPGPTWLAHQQEELDTQLADWRAALPDVAMSARLELDAEWPARLRAGSSLLVAGAEAVTSLRSRGAVRPGDCPIAMVPEVPGPARHS
ncbi:MAG TPA: hypothetical protein VGN18_06200 [Jatrophihabitans sp.]|jgi:hypothetical protein|uniref:hypothetical protein n=1 Tax=Jatrophihabitans sp. TaxID=1932789 RepID=UPI002E041FAD|nr:hypothetical protein [Jatrophihabitans sp.]